MNKVKFILGLIFFLKNFAQPAFCNFQVEHGAIQFIDNLAFSAPYEKNCIERPASTERNSAVSICYSSNRERYLRNNSNNPNEIDQCQERVVRKILRLPHYQAPMPGGEAPIISFNSDITRPTLYLNTSPSLDPVSGGEILVLPSPADASWCENSFQRNYYNKIKELITKTYQREVTGRFSASLNLINNIRENQILSVHCNNEGQLRPTVVAEHEQFWRCGSAQMRILLTQVDNILADTENRRNAFILTEASYANMPDLRQKLNYLCREGFSFGTSGFSYRGKRVRIPNNLFLDSEDYAISAARQTGIDSSLFIDAYSVLKSLIHLKNIIYIQRNPLQRRDEAQSEEKKLF